MHGSTYEEICGQRLLLFFCISEGLLLKKCIVVMAALPHYPNMRNLESRTRLTHKQSCIWPFGGDLLRLCEVELFNAIQALELWSLNGQTA